MRLTLVAELNESSSLRSNTRANGRKRVTMADKSNVQRYGGDLWQRTFKEVAEGYPEIHSESSVRRCNGDVYGAQPGAI